MEILVNLLNDSAKLPSHGSRDAAGYDLYAATEEDTIIPPHSTVKIGTGLSFQLPYQCFAAIFARSGLATKQGLRPANCVGICDSDYRGEYIVAIHNDTDEEKVIAPHERIAQMVLMPYFSMDFTVVDSLTETERGAGGFGDSGRF